MSSEIREEVESLCRTLKSAIEQSDKLGLDIVAARASEALDAADLAYAMISRGFSADAKK